MLLVASYARCMQPGSGILDVQVVYRALRTTSGISYFMLLHCHHAGNSVLNVGQQAVCQVHCILIQQHCIQLCKISYGAGK